MTHPVDGLSQFLRAIRPCRHPTTSSGALVGADRDVPTTSVVPGRLGGPTTPRAVPGRPGDTQLEPGCPRRGWPQGRRAHRGGARKDRAPDCGHGDLPSGVDRSTDRCPPALGRQFQEHRLRSPKRAQYPACRRLSRHRTTRRRHRRHAAISDPSIMHRTVGVHCSKYREVGHLEPYAGRTFPQEETICWAVSRLMCFPSSPRTSVMVPTCC